MLTDLTFLSEGNFFPPNDPTTKTRLAKYEINKRLFDGDHRKIYNSVIATTNRIIPNFREHIDFVAVLNYQRLLSLKVADLIFGDEPIFSAGEEDSKQDKTMKEIIEASDMLNTGYASVIDLTRFGDSVLYVYKDEEKNSGVVDITQPGYWFPIVDVKNINKINNDVLAWVYAENTMDAQGRPSKTPTYFLMAQVHYAGYYEEIVFQLQTSNSKNGPYKIVKEISREKVDTKLSKSAVIPINNIKTSDRTTGYDDYEMVNSIIYEFMTRLTQISKILDKHASPSMQGPASALEQDPITGEWRVKLANYFPKIESTDADVKYLTWEGQLSSAFKELELLINQLYILGESSPSLLGDNTNLGQASSGTALRMRMISPLAKAKRLKNRIDPKLKLALSLASELNGTKIEYGDISIVWADGLPADPKEDAEIMNIRTGGKATMSVNRALKQYDNMSLKNIDEELEQIQLEEDGNPLGVSEYDDNAFDDPELDEDGNPIVDPNKEGVVNGGTNKEVGGNPKKDQGGNNSTSKQQNKQQKTTTA